MVKCVLLSGEVVMFNVFCMLCKICCEIESLSFKLFFFVVWKGLNRWGKVLMLILGLLLLMKSVICCLEVCKWI